MKEPTTPDESLEFHNLLGADLQRYLQITSDWIKEDPDNSYAYYDRHLAWMRIGEPQRALDDLNKAIELFPNQARFEARGNVHRNLGDYD
jgi:tetratricopeptide (TPR) repeat protein